MTRTTPPALEVRSLRHRFGDTVALDGVDLTVAPGEFVALLGPNGAGKTTLVRSAIGLLSPDEGTVRIAGENPARPAVRRRLGVVQQEVGFPSTLTVREVVSGAAARAGAGRSSIGRALAEMGLTDLARRRATKLSGGQQQRLQLAMGLVADPILLVLDEPTVGLDVEARQRFWEAIRMRRANGASVLLTTHRVEEAASVADRIAVLARGSIVTTGTPAELSTLLPDRHIVARTTLEPARVLAHPAVVGLDVEDGRIALTATNAEDVTRWLLAEDPTLSDLTVSPASLDDVLIHLTRSQEVAA